MNLPARHTSSIPLRVKLLLLLLSCLGVALVCQVAVTTRFMVRDKSAYLYDYLMAQVRAVSAAAAKTPGHWKKEDLRISDHSQAQFLFVDAAGNAAFADPPEAASFLGSSGGAELLSKLREQSFRSGVRSQRIAGESFLVAYNRIQGWDGMALGFMKEDLVAAASRSLVLYSVALGATLFFLAGGAAVFLARHFTRRIALLAQASESVGSGDFNLDLQPHRFGHDEIGTLARSFAIMIQKIRELIDRTAEAARMETELKTARLVQERLVPKGELTAQGLGLAAFYRPASECSGDWWTAQSEGNDVFFMVGDVTGHGAAAALITAAAFGALESTGGDGARGRELLLKKAGAINQAVLRAGLNEASMSGILGVYSSDTKELWLINASHRLPLLVERSADGPAVRPLILKKSAALGMEAQPVFEAIAQALPEEAALVLYTDGLLETPGTSGAPLGSKGFVKLVGQCFSDAPAAGGLPATRDRMMALFTAHLGERMDAPDDDLTLLLVAFPQGSRSEA